jgi:hypothetical protein
MDRSELEHLSPKQDRRLADWLAACVLQERSTEPSDRDEAKAAMLDAYSAAGLSPPVLLWCASPLEAYLARAIVACMSTDDCGERVRFLGFGGTKVGSNVCSYIRNSPISASESAIRAAVSERLWSSLTSTSRVPGIYNHYGPIIGTIASAINKIAYIENARLVRYEFGKHEFISDSIWEAACACSEQVMGCAIPPGVAAFRNSPIAAGRISSTRCAAV